MQTVERRRRDRHAPNEPPRLGIGDPMVTGLGGAFVITQVYKHPFVEYVMYRTSGKDRAGRFYSFSHQGIKLVQ